MGWGGDVTRYRREKVSWIVLNVNGTKGQVKSKEREKKTKVYDLTFEVFYP